VVCGSLLLAVPAGATDNRRRRHTVSEAAAAAATSARGVTRSSVVVGGLVDASGAEVGARARFERANRQGGVAGRRVRYVTTEVDGGDAAHDTASIEKLGAEVFAVVPATSAVLDANALVRAGLPFFGPADALGWDANRLGFGFAGAQATLETRVVDPSWGVQLRALLGRSQGDAVAIVTDDSALGAARAEQARASLRASGFRVATPLSLPAPPAPVPDPVPVVTALMATPPAAPPAALVLLASPATTGALARQLAMAGYTGTVATLQSFYQPSSPGLATGLTVLVPYAPLEQRTAANRRLVADVHRVAPDAAVTSAMISGYWAADQFLAALAKTGRTLTFSRFIAVTNGGQFRFAVPDTVGRSSWPAMHRRPVPCGALVQSDGAEYHVVAPYRCAEPVVVTKTPARAAKGSG
jgi:ABC-type branched-subunit amino acid transport system substrate-binding protein